MRLIDENCSIVFQEKEYNYDKICDCCSKWLSILAEKQIITGRILVFMDLNEELICIIIALLSSNYAYVPVDIKTPIERLRSIIKQTAPEVIITSRKYAHIINDENAIYIEEYVSHVNKICFNNQWGEGEAYCIFTSGSTGIPKGVIISKSAFRNFIDGTTREIDLSNSQSILCVTSISFDIFGLESIYALNQGKKVVLTNEVQRENPRVLLKFIYDHNIDCIQMTPSRLQMFLYVDPNLNFLQKLKVMIIGGENLPLNLLMQVKKKLSTKIYNAYGPTETTIWSSYSELKNEEINIGKPMKGVRFYILDETYNLVKDNIIGELYIGGDTLAKGYLNNEEESNMKFLEIPSCGEMVYRTGDLCTKIYENYYWIGRTDNQVKLHGYRIELDEVEKVINQYNGVAEVLVYVHRDLVAEYLVAVIVPNDTYDENDCMQYIRNYLPRYMVPQVLKVVSKFPYTISGKVDRKLLIKLIDKKNNLI